jgi:hypothetical protein
MSHIIGSLQAVSVVSNTWFQSERFYTEGLGYQKLQEGTLSQAQQQVFGTQLGRFALFGHAEGSVVRLIENTNSKARPMRVGARPWDCGAAVFEAGTPDVDKAYWKVLRAKFGAIAPPTQFDCEGPEPLGWILMKSTAFIGPSGEQIFVTQIVNRKGGTSLLKEKSVDGINTPANFVISLKNRAIQQQFWGDVIGLEPVNDLVLRQEGAAAIMGGPSGMGFDMCLMGKGLERIGMEQHIYEPHNEGYDYKVFPCSFENTGLVSACWQGQDLANLKEKLLGNNYQILSDICLPVRGDNQPKGLVFVGPYGEIIELLA